MTHFKKALLFAAVLIGTLQTIIAQNGITVPPTFWGMNMWYFDINSVNPTQLDSILPRVKASGVTHVRIGGITPNYMTLYTWDQLNNNAVGSAQATRLVAVINEIRSHGMDVIVQVGYAPNCSATSNLATLTLVQQAQVAGNLVGYLNGGAVTPTVSLFSIGNEPDLAPNCNSLPLGPLGGYGYNTMNDAVTIATYIRTFSSYMKNASPNIQVMGPDFAGMGSDIGFNGVTQSMDRLISDSSNAYSIMGKIPGINKFIVDIIAIHYYPDPWPNGLQKRADVIRDPISTDGLKERLDANATGRKGIVDMIISNSNVYPYRNISNLKIAITEINLKLGPKDDEATNNNAVIDGYDNRSFVGGQWLAECMGEAISTSSFNPVTQQNESWVMNMSLWSIKESTTTNESLGYLYNNASPYPGRKRPMYYHYKMMAEHMNGLFHPMAVTSNTMVKGFASIKMPYGFKVMLMNRDSVNDFHFRLNLGSSNPAAGGSTVTVNIPLANDAAIAGSITTTQYNSGVLTGTVVSEPIYAQSTIILVFDCHGNILHRIDYKASDAKNNEPPSIVQIGDNPIDDDMIMCGLPGGIGGTLSGNNNYQNTIVPVNSDITLASNATLTFTNCLVVMGEGTKITGTRMNRVILKNSIMVGCNGSTWDGIELSGNHMTGEGIILDSAIIINASNPIVATKIPEINIQKSVIVNGATAIELNESKEYTIKHTWIAGFTSGINTNYSHANFNRVIDGNRIWDVDTAARFYYCHNDKLDITCNDLRFRQVGIYGHQGDLKVQGSAAVGAGNYFQKTLWPDPSDYLYHSGATNGYFYGPAEAYMFPWTSVMNITNSQAGANRDCERVFTNCEVWPEYTSIDEAAKFTKADIFVFPNPSTGEFTLQTKNKAGKYTVAIHDMMGRLIGTSQVDLSTDDKIKLHIKEKGLYIISVQNENRRMTQKVIVE